MSLNIIIVSVLYY